MRSAEEQWQDSAKKRGCDVAASHEALKPVSVWRRMKPAAEWGSAPNNAKPWKKGGRKSEHLRWRVLCHHSCCRSHPQWPAASIAMMLRSEAQQDGWCPPPRRATWSAEGHSGAVLVRRLASAAVKIERGSFRFRGFSVPRPLS